MVGGNVAATALPAVAGGDRFPALSLNSTYTALVPPSVHFLLLTYGSQLPPLKSGLLLMSMLPTPLCSSVALRSSTTFVSALTPFVAGSFTAPVGALTSNMMSSVYTDEIAPVASL